MKFGEIDLLAMGLQHFSDSPSERVATLAFTDGSAGAQYRGHGNTRWTFRGTFPEDPKERDKALAEWAKIPNSRGKKLPLLDANNVEQGEGYISGEYSREYPEIVAGVAIYKEWRLQVLIDGPYVTADSS